MLVDDEWFQAYSCFRKPCQYCFFFASAHQQYNILTCHPNGKIVAWRLDLENEYARAPLVPSWSHPIHNTTVLTAMFPSNEHPPPYNNSIQSPQYVFVHENPPSPTISELKKEVMCLISIENTWTPSRRARRRDDRAVIVEILSPTDKRFIDTPNGDAK